MSSVDPKYVEQCQRELGLGLKAQELRSQWGDWIKENILNVMESEAMRTLRRATTDTERIEAQTMSIAALKFGALIDVYVDRGEQAQGEIKKLSTPEELG